MKNVNYDKFVPACRFKKIRLSLTKIAAKKMIPVVIALGLLAGLVVIPLGCGESGPGLEPAGNSNRFDDSDRFDDNGVNKEAEPRMESAKSMNNKSIPLLDQEVPAHLETATLAMG